jgi:alpha-L-rhamnosidase
VQQAFAVIAGLSGDSIRVRTEASIVNDLQNRHPYFDMGSSGLPVLMRYLTEHPDAAGLTAAVFNKTTFPGYGYFLARGETTWPEDWIVDVPSKIHTCYTGVAGWFTKGLCGIRPDEENPGYKHFIIKPFVVSETDFAEASVGSPYGNIVSRWERKEGKIVLSVTVPPNTTATIYIPTSDPDGVTEGGRFPNEVEGITQNGSEKGYAIVRAVSGKYEFASPFGDAK